MRSAYRNRVREGGPALRARGCCCCVVPLVLDLAAGFFDALFSTGISDVYAAGSDASVLLDVSGNMVFYNMRI